MNTELMEAIREYMEAHEGDTRSLWEILLEGQTWAIRKYKGAGELRK